MNQKISFMKGINNELKEINNKLNYFFYDHLYTHLYCQLCGQGALQDLLRDRLNYKIVELSKTSQLHDLMAERVNEELKI